MFSQCLQCLQLILSHIYNSLLIESLCPVFLLVTMRGDLSCQPKLSKASRTKKPDSFWSLGECENTNTFWQESDVKVTPFPGPKTDANPPQSLSTLAVSWHSCIRAAFNRTPVNLPRPD